MKRITIYVSIVLSLISANTVRAYDSKSVHYHKKASAKKLSTLPRIHVVEGAWGDVTSAEIEALLTVVAGQLLAHFPGRVLETITVSPSRKGPVVLYQKGPLNEYQVHLSATGRHWAEYVYEFSHELFHILARYEYHAPPNRPKHQWFEEALCEAASLYTLKKLALNWERAAPHPTWLPYREQLNAFTRRALSERHRKLPAGKSFSHWFQENAPVLAHDPYQREKNELVAALFLPLLERTDDWSAIAYLNTGVSRGGTSFRDHLLNWYGHTPGNQRQLVADSMKLFQFEPPTGGASTSLTAGLDSSLERAESHAEGAAGVARH